MELALFIYIAGVIGNISSFFAVSAALTFIALVIYITNNYIDGFTEVEIKKMFIVVPFVFGFISTIIPSEKTMYLMLAGYTSQQVLQSETGNKIVKVINAKLDDYIDEITKEKK